MRLFEPIGEYGVPHTGPLQKKPKERRLVEHASLQALANLKVFEKFKKVVDGYGSRISPELKQNVLREAFQWISGHPVPEFFDPTPEQQNVVLVNAATLREAERLIESCEHCNPEGAEIPFDNILDRVTGSDPRVTDFVLVQPAKCPICKREILEKTLVEPLIR